MFANIYVIIFRNWIFSDEGKIPAAFVSTLKKLGSGYINGTRVALGKSPCLRSTVNLEKIIKFLNFLYHSPFAL